MTPGIKPLVAGNWKMNGLASHLSEIEAMVAGYSAELQAKIDMALCLPATLIDRAGRVASQAILLGGQDCHAAASGAHTGDISVDMLKDAGAKTVIVGHSERRTDHGESDAIVQAKADAALAGGLMCILCIGETKAEREGGNTLKVLGEQLAGSLPYSAGADPAAIVIAYEPVWAIGTGMTPTVDDVAEAHAFIRETLTSRLGEVGAKTRILYGGSVKPGNAAELMSVAHVDGALVGGASLKASDFLGIARAYLAIA